MNYPSTEDRLQPAHGAAGRLGSRPRRITPVSQALAGYSRQRYVCQS